MLTFDAEYESANTPTNTFRSRRFPIIMKETKYKANTAKQSDDFQKFLEVRVLEDTMNYRDSYSRRALRQATQHRCLAT
jgi:hypothetical protein